MGTVADLCRRAKQIFADEKAEKPRHPSEPPVPDVATKRLKTFGTLAIQASSHFTPQHWLLCHMGLY